MKKFLIIFSSFILVLVTTIVLLLKNKNKAVTITTFLEAYSLVCPYQQNEEFEIDLYINQTDSFLSDNSELVTAAICDFQQENSLPLQLIEIKSKDSKFSYNEEMYYAYQYNFEVVFPVEDDFSFELSEAYLNLSFHHEEVMLRIGSFSFYKIAGFGSGDLYISRLQGLVNKAEGIKTLVGIVMALKNKTEDSIKITKIQPLVQLLSADYLNLQFLDNRPIPANQNIKDFIPDYEPFSIEATKLEIDIDAGEELRFLFPLKYQEIYAVSRLGFLIEYEIEGEKEVYYYNEFTFFTDYEYSESEVNNLTFQTYENY
ncbi:MAG: hypothetical protein PHX62_03880 [Bacilli bacterium]|nr:hypothetical protein [Bacilli bacterium]